MASEFELVILRKGTKAFIDDKPSEIVLIPKQEKERVPGGGFSQGDGEAREPQIFRIIELGTQTVPPIVKLQDGKERRVDYWLLGEHNCAMAVGDHWVGEDDRRWEVGDIVRDNGYETRGLVAERGE